MGVALLEPVKAQQGEQPAHPLLALALDVSLVLGVSLARANGGAGSARQAKTGVLPGREVGKQGVVLEEHADAPALRGQPMVGTRHLPSIQEHPPAARPLKAGDQAQQGRFATAGWAQQTQQFARFEAQGEIL